MKKLKAEKVRTDKVKKEKKPKEKKKFGLSLFAMLTMLSLIPLIVSVIIVSITSFDITKTKLQEASKEKLAIAASNLANYCRENEINAINVTAYYDYIDGLKDQGIELAILLDGAPCNASIKNENDYRIREIIFAIDVFEQKENIADGYWEENVVIEGQSYYAYCLPIVMADGTVTGVAFAGELMQNVTGEINGLIITFMAIAVCLIIVFSIIALLSGRGLLKAFGAARRNILTLSEGDLSAQKKHSSIVREMNVLLLATESMQGNLSSTIGKVIDVSSKIVSDIAEVTGLSESSAGRAKQITSAMEDLSSATVGMAENVQDISMQMLEIGNCVNDISDNVERLYGSSENILRTNNEAKDDMDIIMNNSKESVTAVNGIAQQIKQTNDSIAEIDKAVELILDISEQTNLLSLNASIEAARAGVHGRGFAVVAEEIRHLSVQSAEGAEMIKNLAGTIVDKSRKSVELAGNVRELIMLEQEGILKTQKKYEELSEDINQSVNEIKAIASKTDNLTEYKERVIENVSDLSAISEETAASSQEVSNNVENIISEVEKVNENCEAMNAMAKDLEVAVAYFHE